MTATTLDARTVARSVDQRVLLHDVTWEHYEALLATRGDSATPRMSYLEGALELMSPSQDHETLKTTLARLIEAYAEKLGLELEGYGSWTLKRRKDERGAEPDECYSIGVAGEVPDLAIEVAWTTGGIDRLEIYRVLGVREVWIWQAGALDVFVLRDGRYEQVRASERLPQMDLGLIVELSKLPTQTAAVRELRARLRSRD